MFQRLRAVFDEGRDPLTLSEDPAGIAPERALVFEIAGTIDEFHTAALLVPGLELLGDEETEFDADVDFAELDNRAGRGGEDRLDKPVRGRLYLAMPDTQALQELVRLWDRYQSGQRADTGFGPWFAVFRQLHRLRAWGPSDRIPEETINYFNEQLAADPDATVRVEIELWSHQSRESQRLANARMEGAVRDAKGEIVRRSSIPEIAYEAVLADLPAAEIRRLIQRRETLLAICDGVMYVRPQSITLYPTAVNTLGSGSPVDPAPEADTLPVAALFDGIPVQRHRLLDGRLRLDDPDGLDTLSVVTERRHGTEMASLILHGDRNVVGEPSLRRPLYLRPVLYAPGNGSSEQPQTDRLLVDTIYRSVQRMKIGDSEGDATALGVFIVNLSLGDQNRPFTGPMSPWASIWYGCGSFATTLAGEVGVLR